MSPNLQRIRPTSVYSIQFYVSLCIYNVQVVRPDSISELLKSILIQRVRRHCNCRPKSSLNDVSTWKPHLAAWLLDWLHYVPTVARLLVRIPYCTRKIVRTWRTMMFLPTWRQPGSKTAISRPILAPGIRPGPPTKAAPTFDRIFPYRLPHTITSNWSGFDTSWLLTRVNPLDHIALYASYSDVPA